ncbi:MAG: hydantoinase/oxoprolinase family protein [Alicyclobacillaceae bacterium]|nr:hydantoinase/oxoprolinase family protein [Alicyclobacillaceae bacterium]
MKRISVDIGGTFTDCFIAWDEQLVEAKAPTTHYNLAQGFMNALRNGAEKLELSVDEILEQVESVRYGTTLGTNALIERSGPRLGLITTAGFEDVTIIGRSRQYADGLTPLEQANVSGADRPHPLIPREYIVGIRERVDYKGEVLIPANPDDIRRQIQVLVDRGVRGFVVVLLNAVMNPVHEDLVADIILEEYPTSYLGSFPVVCSHDISLKKGEYARSMSTIIGAYLHRQMQYGLRSLEMTLRQYGYLRPLEVVHNTGGLSQLSRTHALQTIHAGPIAGLSGAEQVARELEVENLVTTDMGGTSFDIGIVAGGGIKFYEFAPVIDRWRVDIPMMFITAIGAGGGSIAKFDSTHQSLEVGPESAGSEPGPACYDMGGREPTVTDADLLLGYLNPGYYNAGRIRLNPQRAVRAIRDRLARHLVASIEDIAVAIREVADSKMAQAIFKEVALRGYDPRKFTILAYGGNGPTHACGYAEGLEVSRILVPANSSVFSAVGGGNLDQLHIYERTVYIFLYHPNAGTLYDQYEELNGIIADLRERGTRDILRLGYKPEDIQYRVEFDMRYGNQLQLTTLVSPYLEFESPRQILDLIKRYHVSYGERFGEGTQTPQAGISINNVRVVSYVPLRKVSFQGNGVYSSGSSRTVNEALKNSRRCWFPRLGFTETPIYDFARLPIGEQVRGHAVVEAAHTTFVVYPDWTLRLLENGFVEMVRNHGKSVD